MNFARRSICDPKSIRLQTEELKRPSVMLDFNLSRRSRAERSAENKSKEPTKSYIEAMRALQEKLEQLKLENSFLCDNNVINPKNNQSFSPKIELKKENDYLKDLVELLSKNEKLLKNRQEELEHKIKTLIAEQAASIKQEPLESYQQEIQLLKAKNEQILRQLENYKEIEQSHLDFQAQIEQEKKELQFLKNTQQVHSPVVPINRALRSNRTFHVGCQESQMTQNENTLDSLLQDFEISQQKYNQLNTQLLGKFKFVGSDFIKLQNRPVSEMTSTQNSSGMKKQYKATNQISDDCAALNRKLSEFQNKKNQDNQYSVLAQKLLRSSSSYKGNYKLFKPQFNYFEREGSSLSRNDFSIEKIRNSRIDIQQP